MIDSLLIAIFSP